MTEVEVCVVGAGPHGLAVVSHLLAAQPTLRDRIVVLDPSGRWLERWHEQFARLEIDVLRSPIVHHPDVGPAALAHYVGEERLPRSGLPYDPPLTSTFRAFCDRLIDQLGIDGLPSAQGVRSVTCGDRVEVTGTATSFGARAVVWTGNTAAPIVPRAFANAGAWRSADRVVRGDRVDLREIDSLDGEHVLVVGGGLTAGHLATAATARGARVTLVTRRPTVERDFDVEPGWLGPRYLDRYHRMRSARRRLDTARAGRGGGSMPGWMHRRIRVERDAGRLEHVVGDIDAADDVGSAIEVRVGSRSFVVDRCWLATGTRPDAFVDDALGGVVGKHVDGVPVLEHDLRIPGTNVFVTGRLATIQLGPAAGNLWGARTAARRITQAITGIDLDTDEAASIPPPTAFASAGN